MFGDEAPIWRLLRSIPHKQIPWQVRKDGQINHKSVSLKIIAEVYPVLALPGLIPFFFTRGKCAKYNPANKKNFNIEDWVCICEFIEGYAKQYKIKGLSEWAKLTKLITRPTKSQG
jgi:predicted RNase H-like nuclease